MTAPKKKATGGGGETFATRYDANIAYWALSDDDREGVQVVEDEDAGTYSIQPKGK